MIHVDTIKAFHATIHMAGSLDEARPIIQKFVLKGACVQVAECEYIYTGGREKGFTARIMAYARFPKPNCEILKEANELAEELLVGLSQNSLSIETPVSSSYFEHEGAVKLAAPTKQ